MQDLIKYLYWQLLICKLLETPYNKMVKSTFPRKVTKLFTGVIMFHILSDHLSSSFLFLLLFVQIASDLQHDIIITIEIQGLITE